MSNRVIKFRAWDGKRMTTNVISFSNSTGELNALCYGVDMNDVEMPIMQFTGLHDKNGVEIYEGDLLNVFFTSSDGEHIHDCIYKAYIGDCGGLQFDFVRLLWDSFGFNQYPLSTALCEKYGTLSAHFYGGAFRPMIPQSWGVNRLHRERWKENEQSEHFEVIGNIYENPELLKEIDA